MIFSLFWEEAFIRGGVFILKSEILGGRSFEGGVYSRRGVYSRKYGIDGFLLVCQKFWFLKSELLTNHHMVFMKSDGFLLVFH